MAEPLFAGGSHSAVSVALPDARVGAAGASGGPGLTDADDADHGLSPTAVVKRNCATYDVPLVRPVMSYDRAVFAVASISTSVHVAPPSEE